MDKGAPMTPSNLDENNRVFNKHTIKVFVSFSWLCFGTFLSSMCDGWLKPPSHDQDKAVQGGMGKSVSL